MKYPKKVYTIHITNLESLSITKSKDLFALVEMSGFSIVKNTRRPNKCGYYEIILTTADMTYEEVLEASNDFAFGFVKIVNPGCDPHKFMLGHFQQPLRVGFQMYVAFEDIQIAYYGNRY